VLWYLITAQDVWFFQEARHRLREFTRREILPIGDWTVCDDEKRFSGQRWWKYPLCFRIPGLGVTHFASVCPVVLVCVWGGLLAVRHWK
jgi:hypothetical protein